MTMLTRDIGKLVKTIFPETVASTGAGSVTILPTSDVGGHSLLIQATTGGFYLSPLTTALTSTNGWWLDEGELLNLAIEGNGFLSLMSTDAAGKFQMIVFRSV
jgi:uncharacterized membrane protein